MGAGKTRWSAAVYSGGGIRKWGPQGDDARGAGTDHGLMRPPILHKRGVLPVLLLLALVLVGTGMQIAFGAARESPSVPPTATPTPTPTPAVGQTDAVERSLTAVQRAFNAGDLGSLCRRGRLVDPDVIGGQDADRPGCEAELEALMAHEPPLRLTVRRVTVRPDLASVTVTTAQGQDAVVDMVRRGDRWLLSFSNGSDPMPVLTGTD
jgi:hypothetical protein